MTNGIKITPPPGFSAIPISITIFSATTPENTPMAYRASTSTNRNLVISLAFVEANYEALESFLRDRRRQMHNNDLRTELEYFSEDYDEEREMGPRPEPTRAVTLPLRVASLWIHRRGERTVGFEGAQSRGESRVERNIEGGRPLEEAPRGNGGQGVNLPPLLAAHLGRGENGKPLQSSLTSAYGGHPFPNNIGGNLPFNGTFLSHHAQPFIPTSLSIPNGFMPTQIHSYQQPTSFVNGQHLSLPTQTPSGNLPVGGIPAHLPQEGHAPQTFANSNMPSQNGFTYPANMPTNNYPFVHSLCSILDYEDLKAKFRSHFSQQKKFTKTHLAVHNIKQRKGESTRAFITRYTDDTLQILGLHKEQRISGFVHGLRTRSLVEHLFTNLPSTYKGLMEKTYTWVEAREVATNGASSDRRDSFKRSKKCSWDNNRGQKNKDKFSPYQGPNHGLLPSMSKSPKEILATEKAARSFEQPPKMFRTKSLAQESTDYEGKEIIFPLVAKVNNAPVIIEAMVFGRKVGRVYMDSGSSCEIIYERCFEKLNHTNKATKVDLVGFSGERSWSIGRTTMQKMGIAVSTIHGAIKFHTKKGIRTVLLADETNKGTKRFKKILATNKESLPEHLKKELQSLLKSNAKVFTWTHVDMTRIPRTIMVKGKPFNTKHKLNEYNHVKPIKQNKRGLGLDRNMAACKETEKLMKAGILQKLKHQTWVANPVMVKNSDGGWRMCMDFTNINKAYPKDCHPLPEIDWKIESHSGFHLKCFLDAYKGATYQRLVDKVFSHQIRRNLEAYVDDMVIKSTSEKEMLKDIQETFEKFRSINMKLNPKKCLFGVEEGSFLGHLITKQGIKANHSKVKAVNDLDQPRTLKDLQSLKGKLAALSRFLSKGAERSMAFFKVLKGCKGKKNIQWTTEADKALEKIKKLVQALPTLTAPRVGETLTMHLAALKESISVVLAAKRNEGWTPIYFIPFEDDEKKEKPKEVPDSKSKWILYTDGASNSDESRAWLMLIDPEGKEYTYALRFKFETNNNETEYEALLAGLRIA
nr:hypothetical protein [Tanacetum cinerariifolium]